MRNVQKVGQEKTGLKIDRPDTSGGTTSTGNVARRVFSEGSNFIECVLSMIAAQHRLALLKVHTQLSAILKIFISGLLIKISDLGKLCKETYILVFHFLGPNITHTLHKAHPEKLIREYNSGYGLNLFQKKVQSPATN